MTSTQATGRRWSLQTSPASRCETVFNVKGHVEPVLRMPAWARAESVHDREDV